MKLSHENELADYVKEQNAKYKELLKQKLDVEDKLKEREEEIMKLK